MTGRLKLIQSAPAETRPVAIPKVMFVNIGRSPRQDIVPEILAMLDVPVEALEVGALDGLSQPEIEALSAGEDENSVSTHIDGSVRVILSKKAVMDRIQAILSRFDPNQFDLVVILSTGLFHDFASNCPLVNAQRALESAIVSLISEDQEVGLIHPLQRQVNEIDLPILRKFNVSSSFAREGERDSLARAVMDVADCDVIVLHSISYTEADREIVAKASRKPVILARRIVASAIRLLLQRAPPVAMPDLPAETLERIARLTPRERQVLALVCEGLSTKAIAEQLGISPKTVEVHRSHVTTKMGASSLGALIGTLLGGRGLNQHLKRLLSAG